MVQIPVQNERPSRYAQSMPDSGVIAAGEVSGQPAVESEEALGGDPFTTPPYHDSGPASCPPSTGEVGDADALNVLPPIVPGHPAHTPSPQLSALGQGAMGGVGDRMDVDLTK